jgi:LPS export ABC transporter permease LptG/LPS export ABC transporter permease LptF
MYLIGSCIEGTEPLRPRGPCASLQLMKKIDKLLYRAILPPFLIALAVLTFVVFVREFGRLSELLITRNASVGTIGIIAAAILPGILIFSLPLSYLIGLLIGLSGLSGESQIVALRACGVPLSRLLKPVLTVATAVGIVTSILSLLVLPEANDVFYSLKDRISLRQATSQIQPRVFNEQFPNVVFYLDDLAVDRQHWSRVFLSDNSDPKAPRTVLAREGTWITDQAALRLQLHLNNGAVYQTDPSNPAKDNVSVFVTTDIPVDLMPGGTTAGSAPSKPSRKPFEMRTAELWQASGEATPAQRLDQSIELHRRIAIPFSVLCFALIGLTLGTTTKKGGRTSGFVLSLVMVITFYALLMNGLRLASVQKLPPWLGAWGANILLAAIGVVLLAGAERSHWLSRWISSWSWTSRFAPVSRQLHLDAARNQIQRFDDAVVSSTLRIAQISFPKVLDLYISRGFLQYFLWSTVVCAVLFVVLTLFDLLDDIIRNRVGIYYVINYFFFLTPQILMLIIPMAVLLAVLIHFGILEKHSEVTALKAGGWSLYRIALPVFVMTSGVCVSLYLIQDYVLPYANIRQDSIRNIIKGRPPQTSMKPQRKWIFGESNRIFNYDYFDASQNLFVGLTIFEADLRGLKILRRIYASRATVDPSGEWNLEEGWIRDFQSARNGFRRFEKQQFTLPEKSGYFHKEIFEPKESSKLSYLELKDYIEYLKKSGYNATELQVELYKKISFPLSCVVMALLGVPFSFSMGKRGAFYGITLSVMIAMSYWGIYSIFEQLGAYGFLIPLLAAWAPNLLFASAGLVLLFTIRT